VSSLVPAVGWLPLVIAMLLTGTVGGLLAGLLGVGGGIVVVPVLDIVLQLLGIAPSVALHCAVATSLATIIPTALSSTRAHWRRGAVDLTLAHAWAVPLLLGSIAGTVLATHLAGSALAAVFGTVALLAALKMLAPLDHLRWRDDLPHGPAALLLPFGIGTVSTMMGIGGGTLSVPLLTLCGQPIHRAVGTAALFGLAISIPGTIGFLLAAPVPGPMPPASVGYVNLIGLVLIAPASMLAAPWGARLAHHLSRRNLSRAFGVFLGIVAARMLYRAFT
jgi:uncharacterized membrane protein YfcA